MLHLLIHLFIPNHKNIADPAVRRAYGTVCSGLGIALNALLSALKLIAGFLSGSVAVTADAMNNLSDAASSVITMIGFRLSGKADDAEHPFGHGRIEYISGLIVAMVIFLMGFELAKTSVSRILNPLSVGFDVLTTVALIASILVKLYMYSYNCRIARLIHSPSMKATAADAVSDVFASLAVLLSCIVQHFTGANIDAWMGLIVSALILRAGYCAARDTISPLLGNSPSPDFVRQVEEIVLSYDQIHGIHDLIVHDYGPGRTIISLHAEVPEDGNLIVLHDMIDAAERRLKALLYCEAVIHMDPICVHDEKVIQTRNNILAALQQCIDPRISIHDFRMSAGSIHINVIFDVVIPHDLKISDSEVKSSIRKIIHQLDERLFPIITLEHGYTPIENL